MIEKNEQLRQKISNLEARIIAFDKKTSTLTNTKSQTVPSTTNNISNNPTKNLNLVKPPQSKENRTDNIVSTQPTILPSNKPINPTTNKRGIDSIISNEPTSTKKIKNEDQSVSAIPPLLTVKAQNQSPSKLIVNPGNKRLPAQSLTTSTTGPITLSSRTTSNLASNLRANLTPSTVSMRTPTVKATPGTSTSLSRPTATLPKKSGTDDDTAAQECPVQ